MLVCDDRTLYYYFFFLFIIIIVVIIIIMFGLYRVYDTESILLDKLSLLKKSPRDR